MKRRLIQDALSEISDKHITEAAHKHRRKLPWLGAVAALLVIAVCIGIFGQPIIQAKAVSIAKYPKYEWLYREQAGDTAMGLSGFFTNSMAEILSGHNGENAVYSPANLYMALSLSAELTGGTTRQQILDALGSANLQTHRTQTAEFWNACYRDDGDQTLLANSLWLDNCISYHQSVMDTLSGSYYTSVYQGDLDSGKITTAIHNWVNKQTGGLLKDAVNDIAHTPETVLALYSTVYYRAMWTESSEFSKSKNTDGMFHSPNGDIACTYMNKEKYQTYYHWGNSFGAVSLGLKDGSQMWFILPDEGKTLEDVLADDTLSETLFRENFDATDSKYLKVNLTVPKFDIQVQGDLKDAVQALGITDIFSQQTADFSPSVTSDIPVWFTSVNQATRVAIDEKGVTAASYIELPGAGAAMPPEEIIDFILDRPFLFVISNRYCIPLFAGVVNQP